MNNISEVVILGSPEYLLERTVEEAFRTFNISVHYIVSGDTYYRSSFEPNGFPILICDSEMELFAYHEFSAERMWIALLIDHERDLSHLPAQFVGVLRFGPGRSENAQECLRVIEDVGGPPATA